MKLCVKKDKNHGAAQANGFRFQPRLVRTRATHTMHFGGVMALNAGTFEAWSSSPLRSWLVAQSPPPHTVVASSIGVKARRKARREGAALASARSGGLLALEQ